MEGGWEAGMKEGRVARNTYSRRSRVRTHTSSSVSMIFTMPSAPPVAAYFPVGSKSMQYALEVCAVICRRNTQTAVPES
jgi:hypothetical protein